MGFEFNNTLAYWKLFDDLIILADSTFSSSYASMPTNDSTRSTPEAAPGTGGGTTSVCGFDSANKLVGDDMRSSPPIPRESCPFLPLNLGIKGMFD